MKKRALSLLLALVVACGLASPASAEFATFSPPADTEYWHNLSTADANQLLYAMYQGTAEEDTVLVYFSLGCGWCSVYVPQIAAYANENGIEVYAYGETEPGVATLRFTADMVGESGMASWPCVFMYNSGTKQFGFGNAIRSLDDFKNHLESQGLLTPDPPGPALPTVFTDVPATGWYTDAVAWAVGEGITNGTGNNTFSPNRPCTRAQIVTFLWRAAGKPGHTLENPFTDVSPAMGGDYYNAILWAVEKGITNGTSGSAFSPNSPCTRAQAVTFLWRAKDKPEHWADNGFYDVGPSMLPDFRNAIQWAAEYGVAYGTDGFFKPNDTCTRAHIVTFLHRASASAGLLPRDSIM